MIPLPSNWIIEFGALRCPPTATAEKAAADDELAVADLAGRVRDGIQHKVGDLLAERGPRSARAAITGAGTRWECWSR